MPKERREFRLRQRDYFKREVLFDKKKRSRICSSRYCDDDMKGSGGWKL